MRASLCHKGGLAAAVSAIALTASLQAPAYAQRVVTTGEGALALAAELVERGAYDDAEHILQTLAETPAEEFDQRPIAKLLAKIRFEKGDVDEAVGLFEALLEHDPSDWRTRYDLAMILMTDRRDRAAEAHFRTLIKQKVSQEVTQHARRHLQIIDERRVVRLSFRASAAPSTNVNAATTDETYRVPLVPGPLVLDDRARQQSGLGLNYSLGTTVSPRFSERLRGHFVVEGSVADYANADFDQGTGRLEAGFRRSNSGPRGLRTLVAGTFDQQYFGAAPYATRTGIRTDLQKPIGRRYLLGMDASYEDVAYDIDSSRNGPVYQMGVRAVMAMSRALRFGLNLGIAREETEASSFSNTQYRLGTSIVSQGPRKTQVGFYPSVIFRQFDERNQFQFELREDWTVDVAARLAKTDWVINGFYPSLIYRYTDNKSTDPINSYARHAMDVSFDRQF